MSHVSEEQLILHYYLEAEDDASVEAHLAGCESCRAAFRELQQALSLVGSAEVPEPAPDYGSRVWKRIEPRLGLRSRVGWGWLLRPPRWAAAAATVALVAAAFLVGRYLPRPEPPVALTPAAEEVAKRVLLASAADHLDRSQIVLMDLAHAGGKGEVDLSDDLAAARELLESNRIYRQTAERTGEAGLASVLDDLERTLIEIVHSPAKMDAAGLNQLRDQIESGGILFKLRVTASHIRERQTAAARERSRRST